MLTNKRQNQNRVNKIILALKQARINRGITRYQLSKDTGLSDSSISNICLLYTSDAADEL